jgi:uridine phosphorylase
MAPKRPMAQKRPPILDPPGTGRAVIEPADLYGRKRRIPERVVLCFFHEVLEALASEGKLTQITEIRAEGPSIPVYAAGRGRHRVTVCWPGLTAPYAAIVLEDLIALGGRAFIACGGAGVLDGTLPVGSVILPNAALRGEGTSYSYQRRGRYSRPHPDAMRALRAVCREAGEPYRSGKIWTTDGIYRETPALIRRRIAEGCLAVEMEAAAFFAVARYREVVFGQLLYAGDDVSGDRWNHRNWNRLGQRRRDLFDLALAACRKL